MLDNQPLDNLVTVGRIVNRPFGPGPGPKRVAMRPRCDRDAAYTDSPGCCLTTVTNDNQLRLSVGSLKLNTAIAQRAITFVGPYLFKSFTSSKGANKTVQSSA
jgi:hypothetical protein